MKLQENEERTKKWSKLKIKYIKKSIKKVGGFNRLLNNEQQHIKIYKNRGLKLNNKRKAKDCLTQH